MRIRTENLVYKWQGPRCGAFRDRQLKRSREYEHALTDPKGRDALRRREPGIVALYHDIRRRGMVNPLVVKPGDRPGETYVVIVGNQRLAVIRALGWEDVECVLAAEEDSWDDDTRLAQEYERIRYDQVRDEWRG